jgi:hypothetical protein
LAYPKRLRIGGREWRIRRRPVEKMEALGLCHYDKAVLDIATKQSPFDTLDTTLHEVFHAILKGQAFERTPEEEERYVLSLSTGLMGVFQDNPEFAKWLTQPLQPFK